jgi:hypothetical protein
VSDIDKLKVKAAGEINGCRTRSEVKLNEAQIEMHVHKEKASHTEDELQHVTCHSAELIITNRENQLTVVNLKNKIDMLVTELKIAREAYESDLNPEKSNHIMTKNQQGN